jgi:hypothetical protein
MMKYEHFSQPVIPLRQWRQRMARALRLAAGIVGGALTIGVLGYHFIAHLSWIDAVLEASMILGGMGAIAPLTNDAAKLFASAYALFSGLIAVSSMAIILGPWLHRVMHHFHAEPEKGKN